ncbi:carboxyl transferase domain-containing protein [Bradyrhizobium sp. LHD-71]|uniref:acetyl-CoA carboxylase family protein n=1 Tax=Bradyrhizobium sp. LHD-71 TaxID=3072141 RepID=UPI0028108FE9|nr:carboxyl transferase domain-containing protein [Bradyrhizobium sp. LHD-71]MDQ8727444.1 carboxyl transferase domain-containing protein [Bradyrhizobium sp. LHD-71]
MKSLLIANRGEIAIRIARAAADQKIRTVGIFSEDDTASLHATRCDDARALQGIGPKAYLDSSQIISVAKDAGCDAIHPGYGFLSESAAFAAACAEAGLVFVGPRPDTLALFGDKTRARAFATAHRVPVIRGTSGPTTLDEARDFMASLEAGAAVMVKAIAGGGGRGMRPVNDPKKLADAMERCRSEAEKSFGNGDVYVERLFPRARHIEVQIVGDGTGAVAHLWERECSLQRERQKVLEIAPAPFLRPAVRARLLQAATRLAAAGEYLNAGTFEFLVDAADNTDGAAIAFIEANVRLQVEHTVTEEVTGIDLVEAQLKIAAGARLADLKLRQEDIVAPSGFAIQARVNLETMQPDGSVRSAGGTIGVYEPPSGRGVRVDGYGYAGYRTNPRYDSLLAKVIVHVTNDRFHDAAAKTERVLAEFRVSGVVSNIPFLRALLKDPAILKGELHTRFIDDNVEALIAAQPDSIRYFEPQAAVAQRRPGAKLETSDPLAVVFYGKSDAKVTVEANAAAEADGPEGTVPIRSPMQGTIVSLSVDEGASVLAGQEVLVLEAMKMQHAVTSAVSGVVRTFTVTAGDTVFESHPLAFVEERAELGSRSHTGEEIDLDVIRSDLKEVLDRRASTLDAARPKAVAKRRASGQRTARENIEDLCDPGTFVEYGSLVLSARRRTVSMEQLIEESPADGLIMGLAQINGDRFAEEKSRAVVVSYDYTVMAGTQGHMGHHKQDRVFEMAERWRLPVVIFCEGGGGRGSDTDNLVSFSDTFYRLPRLSGLVPLVGIASGRCFAGNAVLLGCCDLIIATANSTIGMAGPAMIEGGGLGVYRPEEVGPMSVQVPNGVVDILVEDEAEAVKVARQYMSYFQGRIDSWKCPDQRELRYVVPENRLRGYDMRRLIETLADEGSVLEIRRGFGHGMITALIRIEGRPLGVIANNPMHLGGAIDADAADKAARFMQLCDAHDIPLLSLNDNPGNMVGPEAERTALVRHCCRTYLIGANLSIPTFFVMTRKSYGLGKLAMTGGSMRVGMFAVAWPTGEFGGMGLEGQVKLGRRRELAAISDPAERLAAYERMVGELYERGKALNAGSLFEVDEVIDPADTRRWIIAGLRSLPPSPVREGKRRPCVDGW